MALPGRPLLLPGPPTAIFREEELEASPQAAFMLDACCASAAAATAAWDGCPIVPPNL